MNWDAIGAIAEGLGALAVIVSLLYIIRQVRLMASQQLESSNRLKVLSVTESTQPYVRHIEELFLDSAKVEIFRRGLESYKQLEQNQQAIFHGILLGFYRNWFLAKQQLEFGLIIEEGFVGLEEDFSRILSCKGAIEWWDAVGDSFGDPRIDALIERNEDKSNITDLLPFLRADGT